MSQRIYKYSFIYRVIRSIFITAIIWFPVYTVVDALVKHSWKFGFLKSPYYIIALVLVTLVFGHNGIILGHWFSSIKTEESGIYFEYFWKFIYIPWNKVSYKSSVIQSDALPALYYGQGLLFRLSFRKIVMIFPIISNYKDLLAEITEYTRQ